jgi:hypothetical protein
MPREASDATLLRNARADIRRLKAELFQSRDTATRAILRGRALENELAEWKERFDLLLKRDAVAKQSGADGREGP